MLIMYPNQPQYGISEMTKIKLKTEKPQKTRSGLYLDKTLHEKVKETAEHNGLSYNETLVLLIKRGLETSQQ